MENETEMQVTNTDDPLSQDDGYTKIGHFFEQEGKGDIGISDSYSNRKGARGQFDVFGTSEVDQTGAGVTFGGEHHRGTLLVNYNGRMMTQHHRDGLPTSSFTHYPYVLNTGYVSKDGWPEKRVLFPSDGFSDDGSSPDMVLSVNEEEKLRVKFRMPGKYYKFNSDSDVTASSIMVDTEQLDEATEAVKDYVNDVKANIAGFRTLCLFNIPTEAVAGSVVPGKNFVLKFIEVAPGSENYNVKLNTYCHEEILSLWKTNLNRYLIFKIRDASGGDNTKYGIYPIDFMYKETGATAPPYLLFQFRYSYEPDGTAITHHPTANFTADSPGGQTGKVNYDDMKIVFTDLTLPIGTGYSDPFGDVKISSFGVVAASGLLDRFRPKSYVAETKKIITSVNFEEKSTLFDTVDIVKNNQFNGIITHYDEYGNSIDVNNQISLTRYLGDYANAGGVITYLLPTKGNITNVK